MRISNDSSIPKFSGKARLSDTIIREIVVEVPPRRLFLNVDNETPHTLSATSCHLYDCKKIE